jgi:gliding motility-associated-like protein
VIHCPSTITVSCIGDVPDAYATNAEFIAAGGTMNDNCSIDALSFRMREINDNLTCPATISRIYEIADMSGNKSSCTQLVVVNDTTRPVITHEASNLTVESDGQGNAAELTAWLAANDGAEAFDACMKLSWTNNFEVLSDLCGATGSASVIFTVTDACGNAASTHASFTIVDLKAPVITCPSAITLNNDPGACGAAITIRQPETVNEFEPLTFTNSVNQTGDASGFYPVGTTIIIWTVTDACGNISTCNQTVVVNDVTAPVISCTGNITINNQTGLCGAQVEIPAVTATDNCGIASISNDFNNGNSVSAFFPVGTSTIVWTVADIHGNISSCQTIVTIVDAELPQMVCPENISISSLPGQCQAQVNMAVPVTTDNCALQSVVNSFNEGPNATGMYPVGTTIVKWNISDIHGNISACSFTVTVTSAPVAVDDNITTSANTAVDINMLANDFDCNNNLNPATVQVITAPLHGAVVIDPATGLATYTPNLDYSGVDSYDYQVCDLDAKCSMAKVFITVQNDIVRSEVTIYNTFTPNADGYNDTWMIERIGDHSDNEVKIFNRWGDEVWSAKNYDNQNVVWNGTNKHNENLPDATYFYVIQLRNPDSTHTGWVMIHR